MGARVVARELLGRPFIAPPDIPADRAKALRAEARADVADLVARDPANKDWRVWQGKLAKPLTKGSK